MGRGKSLNHRDAETQRKEGLSFSASLRLCGKSFFFRSTNGTRIALTDHQGSLCCPES